MTYLTNLSRYINGGLGVANFDAAYRNRVSSITTLFDGQILEADDPLIMRNIGTGTGSFSNNNFLMSVTSGQYYIRTSRVPIKYYAGKSQLIELTFANFHLESGVEKRIGYYTSSSVAPYTANLDGILLYNNGYNNYLQIYNNGSEVLNVPQESWNGDQEARNYSFGSGFNGIFIDFLWLGGVNLRFFIFIKGRPVLAHTYYHTGASGIITRSPRQYIRYEIRSSSGSGSLTCSCSMAATEGSIREDGFNSTIFNSTPPLSGAGATGTVYALKGLRLNSTYNNVSLHAMGFQGFLSVSTDTALFTLRLNPTVAGTFTYSTVSSLPKIQEANGSGISNTVTGGVILGAVYTSQDTAVIEGLEDNYLSYVGKTVDGVQDTIVLCIEPLTANLTARGSIDFTIF